MVDDPSQTRYSTPEYCVAITDAVRALIERAIIINPNFLQYGLGESKDTQRAVMEEAVTGGAVTVPADTGTAEAAVDNAGTTLLDDDKEWVENMWEGYTLTLTAGPGAGETFTIASNTPSILTINGTWLVNPTAATTYNITVPSDKMYDNALATPWYKDQYKDAIIRITAGTGIGQQRKIESMAGHEMTLESAWTTALANADTYEIVDVRKDYVLPTNFFRVTRVKIDGDEIGRKKRSSTVADDNNPAYSLVSNLTTPQIRIENLDGGEMIETFYIPELTLLTTLAQVPMGDIFFRAMQYFTAMRLKGNNYEDVSLDAKFIVGADAAMSKFMTDVNIDENMEVKSHYEDWDD